MKINLNRFVPLGIDGVTEGKWILTGLGASAIAALVNFSVRYSDAHAQLYRQGMGMKKLIPGRVIASFPQILLGCDIGFILLCIAMVMLAAYHYTYHSQGSKAIYLMRRLPSRFELHIRCLGLPVAGAVSAMALLGLLTVLFYLIYYFCTPAQCLP